MGLHIVFAIILLSIVPGGGENSPILARDLMERPAAVMPGTAPEGFALFPTFYGETVYDHHYLQDGPHDTFQIRNSLHLGIVDIARVRTGLYYSTILFTGPVDDASSQGSDLAPWLMNAVQFEYGLSGRAAAGRWSLLGEYGRRSYHPFRRGFAQPAVDIIRGGVAPPSYAGARGAITSMVRLRWNGLFSFWGSDLPPPRSSWALQPALEWRAPLWSGTGADQRLSAFALAMADVLLLRSGGADADLTGELGVSLTAGAGGVESYLSLYRSGDTEERIDGRSPVTLAGLGFRLVVGM